jgi:hypothetical protein
MRVQEGWMETGGWIAAGSRRLTDGQSSVERCCAKQLVSDGYHAEALGRSRTWCTRLLELGTSCLRSGYTESVSTRV